MAKGNKRKKGPYAGLSVKARKRKIKEEEEQRKLSERTRKIELYLTQWASRDAKKEPSSWKFNKANEIWILRHARDRAFVGKSLFKLCLPYIASVQGGARKRYLDELKGELEGTEDKKGIAEQLERMEKKLVSATLKKDDDEKKEALSEGDTSGLSTRIKHFKAKLKRTKKIVKAFKKSSKAEGK